MRGLCFFFFFCDFLCGPTVLHGIAPTPDDIRSLPLVESDLPPFSSLSLPLTSLKSRSAEILPCPLFPLSQVNPTKLVPLYPRKRLLWFLPWRRGVLDSLRENRNGVPGRVQVHPLGLPRECRQLIDISMPLSSRPGVRFTALIFSTATVYFPGPTPPPPPPTSSSRETFLPVLISLRPSLPPEIVI